ncbi:MAG: hypothetical protein IKZ14_06785 [Muribaculaceae bacterium]|nr:hypothetical protein [Muribaculaceae bacterium]
MKKIAKFLSCAAVAILMASCGSPVENATSAIEDGDFVKAAKCLTKLSVEDINGMEAAEQMEVFAVAAAIEMSGNEEASKILNENLDVNKIEKKEMSLDNLLGM